MIEVIVHDSGERIARITLRRGWNAKDWLCKIGVIRGNELGMHTRTIDWNPEEQNVLFALREVLNSLNEKDLESNGEAIVSETMARKLGGVMREIQARLRERDSD